MILAVTITNVIMSKNKISHKDKMPFQTFREIVLEYRSNNIVAHFPGKGLILEAWLGESSLLMFHQVEKLTQHLHLFYRRKFMRSLVSYAVD